MAFKFRQNLPGGFHPCKKVVTVVYMKKTVRLGDTGAVYDMEKLFGRLLILSQIREMNLDNVFTYELALMPSSLSDEYRLLRKGTKAVQTKKQSVAPEHTLMYHGFIIDDLRDDLPCDMA